MPWGKSRCKGGRRRERAGRHWPGASQDVMHRHAGQRKHIVSELSVVGYELVVFSFLLHPSLFDLATRAFAQYAASRPARLVPDRSLALWALSLVVLHLRPFAVLLFPLDPDARGLVLDFVGADRLPSRLLLLAVNALVLALQLVQLCITHESPSSPNTDRGDLDPDEPDSELVLHLRFRKTLERLAHPPPPPLELPPPVHASALRPGALRAALLRQLARTA